MDDQHWRFLRDLFERVVAEAAACDGSVEATLDLANHTTRIEASRAANTVEVAVKSTCYLPVERGADAE